MASDGRGGGGGGGGAVPGVGVDEGGRGWVAVWMGGQTCEWPGSEWMGGGWETDLEHAPGVRLRGAGKDLGNGWGGQWRRCRMPVGGSGAGL